MKREVKGLKLSDIPEISKEWDYEKNEGVPSDYAAGSNKKAWWKCENGHSYESHIYSRTIYGKGCKYCKNQAVIHGFNDLATTNPELIEEWDFERNGSEGISIYSVSHGADLKVWWKCKNGHSWKALIYSRTGKNNSGCPYCSNYYKSSLFEATFRYYIGKNFVDAVFGTRPDWLNNKETDIYIPSLKLAIEVDGMYHTNREKDIEKNSLVRQHGDEIVRIRMEGLPDISNDCYCIPALKSVNLIDSCLRKPVLDLLEYINKKYALNLNLDVNISRDSNSIRAMYNKWLGENSIAAKKPELVKEWDYEKNAPLEPENIPARCNEKFWWKCSNGHSYPMKVSHRFDGHGCPCCCKERQKEDFQDKWWNNFQQVKKYKEEYGNIEIPTTNKKMYYWFTRQRGNRKKGLLSLEQIQALDSLGMVWDVYDISWDSNYSKLKKYGINHNYDYHLLNKEDKNLYIWLTNQKQKWKKGKLTEEQINELLGICISLSYLEEQWNKRYLELKAYYEERLSYDGLFKDNRALYDWVVKQRRYYKDGKLSELQIEKLKSICVPFIE